MASTIQVRVDDDLPEKVGKQQVAFLKPNPLI